MKLTVRKSLFIALILFAFLVLASLGLTFLRIDRKTALQGVFVYRDIQPVICEEGGFVSEILVRESGFVQPGDPIMVMVNDDLDMEIRLSENRLNICRIEFEEMLGLKELDLTVMSFDASSQMEGIAAKRERLAYLEGIADTRKGLYDSKLASKEDYERALLDLKEARSELSRLEIDLKQTGSRLAEQDASALLRYALKAEEVEMERQRLAFLRKRQEKLTVTSKAEGRLISENIDRLRNTFQNKGTPIGDVVSFDAINFLGYAEGTDVIRIEEGQEVFFNVELFRRRNLITGKVVRVGSGAPGPAGVSGESFRGFAVEIEVDNRAFFDRGNELYIQAGIPAEAIVITEKDVSLIRMLWERVVRVANVY